MVYVLEEKKHLELLIFFFYLTNKLNACSIFLLGCLGSHCQLKSKTRLETIGYTSKQIPLYKLVVKELMGLSCMCDSLIQWPDAADITSKYKLIQLFIPGIQELKTQTTLLRQQVRRNQTRPWHLTLSARLQLNLNLTPQSSDWSIRILERSWLVEDYVSPAF